MFEYFITDTLSQTRRWVRGKDMREALIAAENSQRNLPLQSTAEVHDLTVGDTVCATIGFSQCVGHRQHVVRAARDTYRPPSKPT